MKSWLIGKDSDAGRDWGQEEKGTTEDEMAGWHHWLNGRESEWTPGDGDGQGDLACCDSWGHKESDTTERLIWSEEMDNTKRILYPSFLHLEGEGQSYHQREEFRWEAYVNKPCHFLNYYPRSTFFLDSSLSSKRLNFVVLSVSQKCIISLLKNLKDASLTTSYALFL